MVSVHHAHDDHCAQALGYDLVAYAPYKAIDGFLHVGWEGGCVAIAVFL